MEQNFGGTGPAPARVCADSVPILPDMKKKRGSDIAEGTTEGSAFDFRANLHAVGRYAADRNDPTNQRVPPTLDAGPRTRVRPRANGCATSGPSGSLRRPSSGGGVQRFMGRVDVALGVVVGGVQLQSQLEVLRRAHDVPDEAELHHPPVHQSLHVLGIVADHGVEILQKKCEPEAVHMESKDIARSAVLAVGWWPTAVGGGPTAAEHKKRLMGRRVAGSGGGVTILSSTSYVL